MATKDAVINDVHMMKIMDWQRALQDAEIRGRKELRIKVADFREILNYIFDLEQDLRWNTSKYGVAPPVGENESDGRIF